jgi:hypothetical protein
MIPLKEHPQGLILPLHVQPRSSKNEITGCFGDAVKLRVTAAPVEDAANKMIIQFLSKILAVPRSSLEILSGHTGRNKQVFIRAGTEGERKRIKDILERFAGP